MIECSFSEQQTPPANFYIGLCEDASIADDASLGDLTELVGEGYDRQAVASNGVDFTSADDGADGWQVTTKTVTFTADTDSGGAWNTAKKAFLATTIDDTGMLIGWMNLNGATGYTLSDGQHVDVQMVLRSKMP
jgi:hypothetical protein